MSVVVKALVGAAYLCCHRSNQKVGRRSSSRQPSCNAIFRDFKAVDARICQL